MGSPLSAIGPSSHLDRSAWPISLPLLDDASTFYGDLFAHVVSFKGDLYLETGLHRALRAALQGRTAIHARILEVTEEGVPRLAPAPPSA